MHIVFTRHNTLLNSALRGYFQTSSFSCPHPPSFATPCLLTYLIVEDIKRQKERIRKLRVSFYSDLLWRYLPYLMGSIREVKNAC